MKTYVILVFFALYGGEPQVRSEIVASPAECHARGISAVLYGRERTDIEAPSYRCIAVTPREPGQPA